MRQRNSSDSAISLRLARDQDAHLHEPAPGPARRVRRAARLLADAVACARGPANPVEIAKPSGAALHVRLEEVDRAAEALAPRGRLGLEPIDERAEVLLAEEPLVRFDDERAQEVLVAGEQPEVEQRRRGLEVLLGEGHDLVRAQDLMAHGEAGVPQRVEERFDERPGLLGADDLRVDDEDDVGVAAERDGAAAEAPDRRERHAVRQPRLARRALEEELEARIEKARVRASERHAVLSALEPRDEADAMALERVAERHGLERRGRDAVRPAGASCRARPSPGNVVSSKFQTS